MVAAKSAVMERLMDLKIFFFFISFDEQYSGVLSRMSPSYSAYFGYLKLSVLLPRLFSQLRCPVGRIMG